MKRKDFFKLKSRISQIYDMNYFMPDMFGEEQIVQLLSTYYMS